ncbi:MAG: DUF1517 domain-containing protein [Cyanothece sp. SIO1E1]|nr:DUF1517 domain-containing protein [Cyanothece sp. SIO1E1]
MHKKIFAFIKPLLKPLVVIALVVTLILGQADGALAARGGRIGGGSFRMPSRSYAPPTRTYRGPAGGGYYPGGGGFGFPFLLPFFGFGGGFGGLFSILIFMAIANFLFQSFRRVGAGEDFEYGSVSPSVSITRLQIGLLAEARSLQKDLNRIAQTADTGSSEGLTQVLQETTLSLLRHPEYWFYASTDSCKARLEAAEGEFNRLALAERSKFSEETLSNFNSQLKQTNANGSSLANSKDAALSTQEPGEYIVATIVVAALDRLDLPKSLDSSELRQTLSKIGAIPSEKLLALEVLWAPQSEGDTLSADELIAQYPDLRLI